ncbi:MAG TPA: efflux RND transporter periplasmic adaptor subunit [Patescibacteria group bacterium]|nr:efflux RND transporter periplasmic adaptor subunit [Patescibacteria group bacterium]
MTRKVIIAVILVLLIAGGLVAIKALQVNKSVEVGKTFAPPPESVSVATVREEKWQNSLTAIGTINAIQGVTITPEIAGTVTEISFDSGVVVAKGDLLVRLDTSSEEAQLRAVQAQLELARINLTREQSLRKETIGSQSDLDSAEATMKQTEANADAIRATIAKKTIRAPFAGQLGIRQINLGQYLDAGKPIVWLQTVTPVYADFTLPQQELARLTNGMQARLRLDAYPDRIFEGSLTAINPGLDQTTRSVGLRATFDNPNQMLRPGMFARVEVLLPENQNVLVVPAISVLRAPSGDSVYVVEPDGADGKSGFKVRQQLVRLGADRGDFVSIESGLKVGEHIVSSGQFKLRTGMAVVEQNDVVPKSAEAPRPSDS